MENPLLLTILITGLLVCIIKISANYKLRKLDLSNSRYETYKKMIKKPLGAIFFLFLKIES